jgi:prepilin-type processing-associated H-X9-DG protein
LNDASAVDLAQERGCGGLWLGLHNSFPFTFSKTARERKFTNWLALYTIEQTHLRAETISLLTFRRQASSFIHAETNSSRLHFISRTAEVKYESFKRAGILLPALSRAREQAKNVQCAARLRNVGQAVLMYANENKGKVPQHYAPDRWLWDISFADRDLLVKKGGIRQTLYCPFFPEQDADALWNFDTANELCVIGYMWLGRRPPSTTTPPATPIIPVLLGRGYVDNLRPPKPASTLAPALAALYPRLPAETELAGDATFQELSLGTDSWAAKGGWSDVHVTPHIRKSKPLGGNMLFLDFHVGWRTFKDMRKRGTVDGVDFYF